MSDKTTADLRRTPFIKSKGDSAMTSLYILLCILTAACLCLAWLYGRLCGEIRSLRRQLEEIRRGSHIELAVGSRQKILLALCRLLNQVLSAKDADYILYQQKERLLKQNITSLAHDIRTPLTGASGYVQLALECEDTEKEKHFLQAAQTRMEELEDMLEKLFLYTKLTSDDFTPAPENQKKLQALPLLGECLLGFHAQFERAGYAPEVLFEKEDYRILGEEEALRRIFQNLIQNALLHGSGGLRILQRDGIPDLSAVSGLPAAHADCGSAASDASGPALPMTASPCGCIIFENPVPEADSIDISRLFDRFYKADPARGKASSGLGLFIVKELMCKMGGTVSARLEGGLFKITLQFPDLPSG